MVVETTSEDVGRAALERRAAVHRALGDPVRVAIVDAVALSDRTPSELAGLTGLPTNLLAFHLDVLERAGVVTRTTSEGDRRRRYVHLERGGLDALVPSRRLAARDVLFVCTRNSARSPLSAALWERRTGLPGRSAGHDPAPCVDPRAVAVARAHGLDLTGRVPQGYDAVSTQPDLMVSVCDRAREAGLPFEAPLVHWSVPDPVGRDEAAFDAAFRELVARIDLLAAGTGAAA